MVSNCSAFVFWARVTLPGAWTICTGSHSCTALIVPKGTERGKSAIATWASPVGTSPKNKVLLVVSSTVPGFQVLVGHQEIAGKSLARYSCLPFLSIRRANSCNAGRLGVLTLQ